MLKRRHYDFANYLKMYRERSSLRQEELARSSGVSITAYRNWETGISSPRERNLKKLIETLYSRQSFSESREIEDFWDLAIPETALDAYWFSTIFEKEKPGTVLKVALDFEEEIPPSIFFPGGNLPGIEEFYGRTFERKSLQNQCNRASCTSIVGPRRIGKTWLLQYLKQTSETQKASNLKVIYLSAGLPSCATLPGFIAKVMGECGRLVNNQDTMNLETLEDTIKTIRESHVTPILCIDEFEKFIERKEEFGLSFYEVLKALNTSYNLGLVFSSRISLYELSYLLGAQENIFNNFYEIILTHFSEMDAKKFVQDKGTKANFSELEIKKISEHGVKHPLKLQIAGQEILEVKTKVIYGDQGIYRPGELAFWQNFEAIMSKKFYNMISEEHLKDFL